MKNVVWFTIAQIVLVLALVLWWPEHHEIERPSSALQKKSPVPHDADSSADRMRSASGWLKADAAEPTTAIQTDPDIHAASTAPTKSAIDSRGGVQRAQVARRRTRSARPFKAIEDSSAAASILPVPTVDEMEQALAVPLAFVSPPPEAGFTQQQITDLANVATQFNATVSATGQAPTDPAYAETYHNSQSLADEQVYAAFGQEAYEALVNARAQAAGNVTPAPSP